MKYTFEDTNTGKLYDLDATYEELESFIKDNPHMEQIFSMNIGDPVRLGVIKPNSQFQKEVIGRIKENFPGNTMDKSRFTIPREI